MTQLPSTTRVLLRGLLRRRPGLIGRTVPRLESHASGVMVDAAWLRNFRTLADSPDGDTLPLMAPQILAGPLHAQVLSDPAMPVGVLGLVHVRQQITQLRPIPATAPLDLDVWLQGHRPARQGAELDLHTSVRLHGEVAWEGVTTALARGPWKDDQADGAPPEADPLPDASAVSWRVPEDIGRRWRHVAGDPNPIHLHRLVARPFGFKAAIAHGTWLLARILGTLGEADGPATVDARFRRPVFLPATASFRHHVHDGTIRFELRDPSRDKAHLQGELVRAPLPEAPIEAADP